MEDSPNHCPSDDACLQLDSLPEIVENVSQAQKRQACEIEQHQLLLSRLQDQLVRERAKVDSWKEEVRTCLRKICLHEEDTARKKTHCAGLQEAIGELVMANASLKQELARAETDRENEESLHKQYKDKMKSCEKSIRDLEAEAPPQVELVKQMKIVQELENKRNDVKAELITDQESGELLAKLRLEEESHQLQIAKAELQEKFNHLQQEVSKEVAKQASIKQDIEVLQKRNQAQLTRLKCQLKEAQLRNWQWNQEAVQLESQLKILSGRSQSQD